MTNKEKELIKDNLRAYNANFKYIKIVYLNGWLYGAVQAIHKRCGERKEL